MLINKSFGSEHKNCLKLAYCPCFFSEILASNVPVSYILNSNVFINMKIYYVLKISNKSVTFFE